MKSINYVFFVFVHLTVPTLTRQSCDCDFDSLQMRRDCIKTCEEDTKRQGSMQMRRASETYNPYNQVNDAISSQCKIDGNVVPTYGLCLIGIVIFLLTASTIILGIMLYRTKLREYKIFKSPASPENTLDANSVRRYVTQTSQDNNMSLLNLNTKQDDRNSDTVSKNDEQNCISGLQPPSNPLKIYKSVRKPVEHQVILKEQMRKICEDALAKSQNNGLRASLKDLNKLLNDDDAEKRQKSEDSIIREKSASYPQLDIYDEAPRNIPVTNLDDDDDEDIPLYDNLPAPNNIIVRDYATNYVMPLTMNNGSEPSYINARSLFP